MITLYLREHSTHNQGYSIDFVADLDKYSNSSDLTEDLFEYTRERLEGENVDLSNMEEWLITDWELDDNFGMRFNEYADLDMLIEINNKVNDLTDEQKRLLSAFVEKTGEKVLTAIEITDDILYYNGTLEEWAEEMLYENSLGEIDDSLKTYIDLEYLARDLSYSGYEYSDRYSISFYYR